MLAAAGMLAASAACSIILDHGSSQCQTDGDCARFGGRPSCQAGVCVDLGQGPKNCFFRSPTQPDDFANQCSSAECLSFDDCTRLGVCNGGDGPMPVTPPAMEAGAASNGGLDGGDPGLPTCMDPQSRPKVIYINGSSNFPPLLQKLAPLVNATGFTPVFLVTSSCTGVKTVLSPTPTDRMITDPPRGSALSKYAQFFDANGNATPCLLGGAQPVDVGESDVFSDDCDGFMSADKYPNVSESFGPTQAMAFIVNTFSDERAISEEAARVVFGLGGDDGMSASAPIPWTEPARYYIRNSGTGTQQMIGHAIGLSANAFWGVDFQTADRVFNAVRSLGGMDAKEGIGIISVDYYDKDRGNLRALAYRGSTQTCAYLPDSSDQSYDKRNVRDGHYPIWGPLHFFSTPGDDAAAAFLSVASVETLDKTIIDAFIGASLVPKCAMMVERTTEVGPLSSYPPPQSCGCYFESQASMLHQGPANPAGCTVCTGPQDCPHDHPACNLGFCEVQ